MSKKEEIMIPISFYIALLLFLSSMHIGKLLEIANADKSDDKHTPTYYKETEFKIPFWFKITNIE